MAKAGENGADARTTTDVAKLFGVTSRTIARICSENGIGTVVNPRLRILTAADVEKVRPLVHGRKGNPNFGKQTANPAKSAAKPPAKRRPKQRES